MATPDQWSLMPRPATRNGVTKVAGGYRWRVMIAGRKYTGVERTEAAAIVAREACMVRRGGEPDADPTVAVWLEGHIGTAKGSETTVENWRWAYEALPEAFTARRLSEVTPPIVAHRVRPTRSRAARMRSPVHSLCVTRSRVIVTLRVVPRISAC